MLVQLSVRISDWLSFGQGWVLDCSQNMHYITLFECYKKVSRVLLQPSDVLSASCTLLAGCIAILSVFSTLPEVSRQGVIVYH